MGGGQAAVKRRSHRIGVERQRPAFAATRSAASMPPRRDRLGRWPADSQMPFNQREQHA